MPTGLSLLSIPGLLGLVLLAGVLTAAVPASAQKPGTKVSGGITISPALSEITLSPGESEKTFEFTVTNNTRQAYEFALSLVDFGSLDESGGVLFVGRADKALNYEYGLSNWASFGQDRIVVEPRTSTKIPVIITNRESLAPGGHYGAVLVTPTEPGEDKKVQINQVASALVFLKKQGGEVYNLQLHSASVNRKFSRTPDTASLRFQNTGNVHTVPRGTVTMTDPLGRVVKRGYINADSSIVLPESFRRMSVPFEKLQPTVLPGTYTVTVDYRHDNQDKTTAYKVSFFYINGWYVVAAVLLVLFLVLWIASRRFRTAVRRRVTRLAGMVRGVPGRRKE